MASATSHYNQASAQEVEQYAFEMLSALARMADDAHLEALASDLRKVLKTDYRPAMPSTAGRSLMV